MRILYINALYSPIIQGGAEISLKALVEGMQAEGHEVVVLSLKPAGEVSIEQIDGVKVYRAKLKNSYWPFTKARPGRLSRLLWHVRDQYNTAMQAVIRDVIIKEKPDIVSCHNLVGWSIAAWDEVKRNGIPLVQVLHDLYLLCPNSDMFKGERPCTKQCFSCALLRHKHRKLSARVDAVVGISKFVLERFKRYDYFNRAQQYVIYNTREIADVPLPVKRDTNQPFRIGYIGTLAKKKGIEWLIEQFSRLDIQAELKIAGGGKKDYEHYLHQLTKGKNINFVGYVDSEEFYKTIDVLVVPSLWEEPLGMVAIEALDHHVPVIANRRGGLKETVKHEHNGLLCEDAQENSLGEAMARLYHDTSLYTELVKNAKKSMNPILSKHRMIREYSTVLHETINKHRS